MPSKALSFKALPLLGLCFSLLLFPAFWVNPTQAQSRACSTDGNYEPPSSTSRTIQLPDFGIEVDIPSNYRTMRRENGQVEILHPDDFAMLQCIAKGGYGGHGYYGESIELVKPNRSMSLKDQTMRSMGYSTDAQGNRKPIAEVSNYDEGDFSGYIATSEIGYAVIFMGKIPGRSQLLQVTVFCDCEVSVEDLTNLLGNIRLMKQGVGQ